MEIWRHRALVLEAMVLISIARLLIRFVPFGRWRSWLGEIAPGGIIANAATEASTPQLSSILAAHRRAETRSPTAICLPFAIALHTMLQRRGFGSDLVVGVLPGQQRGSLDDLHAWVELDAQIIWGSSKEIHTPLFRTVSGTPD